MESDSSRQPAAFPQCSHVAGICHNILSCTPEELLEQRALLEQVQLDDPSVSSDPSPPPADPRQPCLNPETWSGSPSILYY